MAILIVIAWFARARLEAMDRARLSAAQAEGNQ